MQVTLARSPAMTVCEKSKGVILGFADLLSDSDCIPQVKSRLTCRADVEHKEREAEAEEVHLAKGKRRDARSEMRVQVQLQASDWRHELHQLHQRQRQRRQTERLEPNATL